MALRSVPSAARISYEARAEEVSMENKLAGMNLGSSRLSFEPARFSAMVGSHSGGNLAAGENAVAEYQAWKVGRGVRAGCMRAGARAHVLVQPPEPGPAPCRRHRRLHACAWFVRLPGRQATPRPGAPGVPACARLLPQTRPRRPWPARPPPLQTLHPCALEQFDRFVAEASGKLVAVFLDYDGELMS